MRFPPIDRVIRQEGLVYNASRLYAMQMQIGLYITVNVGSVGKSQAFIENAA